MISGRFDGAFHSQRTRLKVWLPTDLIKESNVTEVSKVPRSEVQRVRRASICKSEQALRASVIMLFAWLLLSGVTARIPPTWKCSVANEHLCAEIGSGSLATPKSAEPKRC